jgi:FkbM family methyltransferase
MDRIGLVNHLKPETWNLEPGTEIKHRGRVGVGGRVGFTTNHLSSNHCQPPSTIANHRQRLRTALTSLLRHPKPVRFLLAQFLWRTGWGVRFTFPLRGFRLHLHPANLAWQLWVDRHQRDADLDLIRDLLRPGDVMIDVGANIGFTAIEGALAVGSTGCVHAIEPHPSVHRFLKENLQLNGLAGRVNTHELAVTDAAPSGGFLSFSDDRRDDMNALLEPGTDGSLRVPATTLDTLFPDLPRCDLLKIDVEGAELAVLRGGASLLARTRQVLIEAGDPNSSRFGVRSADLLAHLESAGFTVTEAGPVRKPVSLELYKNHVGNWLASRNS